MVVVKSDMNSSRHSPGSKIDIGFQHKKTARRERTKCKLEVKF